MFILLLVYCILNTLACIIGTFAIYDLIANISLDENTYKEHTCTCNLAIIGIASYLSIVFFLISMFL